MARDHCREFGQCGPRMVGVDRVVPGQEPAIAVSSPGRTAASQRRDTASSPASQRAISSGDHVLASSASGSTATW